MAESKSPLFGIAPTERALRRLAWDSQHFQFPVAQILESERDDTDLAEVLTAARQAAVRLVYWPASSGRSPAADLLAEFHGRLVDRKATYAVELPTPGRARAHDPPRLVVQPRGPAPPELLALGVAAGAYSRFQRDPWIPRRAFERLYEIWMNRSTLGELAEAVLVALPPADGGPILGVVTVEVREKAGHIGLIAVHNTARRQGISSALVAAAHEWMAAKGLARSQVVTQRDNEPACRLYEQAGYRLVELVHFYHFWPLGPASVREPAACPEP